MCKCMHRIILAALRSRQAADLPVTLLSILVNVITTGWGKGVAAVCAYVCKEEGGDNNGGEADR